MAGERRQGLGPGYAWVQQGAIHCLQLHTITLVEAEPARNAWLVTVRLQGPGIESQRVAVPSLERAMGWSTHWARLRHIALERRVQEVLSAGPPPEASP